jgi:hypothetical protein
MLALGIKIIRNAETEIRNAEVEKVFGKAGLSPTVEQRGNRRTGPSLFIPVTINISTGSRDVEDLQQAGEEGYPGSYIYLDLPCGTRSILVTNFHKALRDNSTLDMEIQRDSAPCE